MGLRTILSANWVHISIESSVVYLLESFKLRFQFRYKLRSSALWHSQVPCSLVTKSWGRQLQINLIYIHHIWTSSLCKLVFFSLPYDTKSEISRRDVLLHAHIREASFLIWFCLPNHILLDNAFIRFRRSPLTVKFRFLLLLFYQDGICIFMDNNYTVCCG